MIGFLSSASPGPFERPLGAAFEKGLAEFGYIVGRNASMEKRWAEGHHDRLPELAQELASRKVDLIVVPTSAAAMAVKRATSTIPIVFALGADPIATGLVASLAKPGGNLTGISTLSLELTSKKLDLLTELLSDATTIALLIDANNSNSGRMTRDAEDAARRKGIKVVILKASTEHEIDEVFNSLSQQKVRALLVGSDPLFFTKREQLVTLAARHSVPMILGFPATGALISYGTKLTAVYQQLGHYAGQILNGAKPADLPILQPTTFELVINLKTAKALDLTISPSLLARADEVIE